MGQGLYDIIEKTDFKAELAKICVKDRLKKRTIPMEYFTFDRNELLFDEDINVIVELIDDAAEAYKIVKTALQNGKHVVTANKKMMAEHLYEFADLQKKHGVSLLYEASVCGSIPIIRNLAEYYDNEMLHSVSGIFNGSSNYILTKVIQEKLSYDEALKQAQDLGFAETDPTLDVGGFDPKYKLCIVTAHAYGVFVAPEEVFNYGIQSLSEHDLEFASEKGYKLKLLANVLRVGDQQLTLFVMPYFVPREHYLYYVENEYNGVIVEAAFSDKQVFVGKGAGGHPTGSAVLSDISALRYDYKYEYKKYALGKCFDYTRQVKIEIYLRYHREEDLKLFDFEDISIKYSGKHYNYVIGQISLAQLFEKQAEIKARAIFIANTGHRVALSNAPVASPALAKVQ
ncbi:MAG: homoserine dehydrogenase [Microscillaceae bacterium]